MKDTECIRRLKTEDIVTVCRFVNDNWTSVYQGYVNPSLLTEDGCRQRAMHLKEDFQSKRLSEYVYTANNQAAGLLSCGPTEEKDYKDAFEIWRIYIASAYQGRGIGSQLLKFAEDAAIEQGYSEILIWAFKNNRHALSFYMKHGYRIDKEEYLDEPYLADAVRLMKRIRP